MKKILSLILLLLVVVLTGCTRNTIDDKKIVVGASPTPHAEILELTREYLLSKGYELEIIEFTEYVLPNKALSSGELDANFFQHIPYLKQYNLDNKVDLVDVLKVHFEPIGVYKGKGNSFENIQEGSTIAIPNDTTNCARALQLLAQLGLITVDTSKGLLATEADILLNPKNLKFTALEAASIPAQLPYFDFAVINGNYAIGANISTDKLVATEDSASLAAQTYANVIVVKSENANSEAIKVLIEALKQDFIKEYILNNYKGLVLPIE
jgi:D-methionine transport system substrate-binding protein